MKSTFLNSQVELEKEWERTCIPGFKQKRTIEHPKGEKLEKNNRHNVDYP